MDKTRTYAVGTVAPYGVMDNLKALQACPISHDKRWVHCGAMFYDAEWKYIDADLSIGVVEAEWSEEVKACGNGYRFECFEFEMSVAILRSFLGVPFSMKSLKALASAKRFLVPPCGEGVTCAEILMVAAGRSDIARIMRSVDMQEIGLMVGMQEVGHVGS